MSFTSGSEISGNIANWTWITNQWDLQGNDVELVDIDLCKNESYGPVMFPNDMTSHEATKLCNLFDNEIFLIEDEISGQQSRSLMDKTNKGNQIHGHPQLSKQDMYIFLKG